MAPSESMKDEMSLSQSPPNRSIRIAICPFVTQSLAWEQLRLLRETAESCASRLARTIRFGHEIVAACLPCLFFFTTQRIGVNRDDQDRLFRAFLLSLNPRRVYIGPVAFGAAGSRRKNANKLAETLW
jgi:hypothetical protein